MYCNRCASYLCHCGGGGLANQLGMAAQQQSQMMQLYNHIRMQGYQASADQIVNNELQKTNHKKPNKKLLLLRK